MLYNFRKPRLNSQLVAQQVAQQYVPPVKKEKSEKGNGKHKPSGSGSGIHKKHRSVAEQGRTAFYSDRASSCVCSVVSLS